MSADEVYSRLGAVYPWASPEFIRCQMTEAQLQAYLQNINKVEDQRAKAVAYHLSKSISELMLAMFVKRSI